MKNILFILLFVSSICFSQVSQRCPVCPPSLNGVPSGYVLTDSSGHAKWKAIPSTDTSGLWSSDGSYIYQTDISLPVGIGTTTPQGILDVVSGSARFYLDGTGEYSQLSFNGGDDAVALYGSGAYSTHYFRTTVGDASNFTQYNNRFEFYSGSFTIGDLAGNGSGFVAVDNNGLLSWSSGGGGGWSLTGNAGTDPSVNFIGTTDKDTLIFKVNNVFAGIISGKQASIGKFSFQNNTTGVINTAFGYSALKENTTGSWNVGIGGGVLIANTEGYSNTGVGNSALKGNITGYRNTAVGELSMNNLIDGFENTSLGDSSMASLNSGSHNVCIGSNADVNTGTTKGSVSIGAQTIASDSSVALGIDASADTKQFALSPHITNIKAELNGQTAGYVLTTNGTTADWQSFVGTPIKDSIATTGATVSPAINTTHVITSAGAITSATLSFPSGTTGDWIIVVFNKAIATLTNSGTGATTVGLVAPLLGTSKTYVNINGLWY